MQFIVYDSIDLRIPNWLRSFCAMQSWMSFASRNAPLASLAKAPLELISPVRFRSQFDRAQSIIVLTIDCLPYFESSEPPIGVVYRRQSRAVSCGRQTTIHGSLSPCMYVLRSMNVSIYLYLSMYICVCAERRKNDGVPNEIWLFLSTWSRWSKPSLGPGRLFGVQREDDAGPLHNSKN